MAKKGTRHPITGCRVDSLFEDVWLISPEQLEARIHQIVKIDLNELVKQNREAEAKLQEQADAGGASKLPYRLLGNTAVVTISGITTKYPTSFESLMGGTSTFRVQQAVRHALANPEVQNIFLHVDGCPGGNASGAFDLADDIRAADAVKPVWAHIDDVGTSAGMLFASSARHVTSNKNAMVGSIGVMSKLEDTSRMYEAKGVRVIPILAGKYKGVGLDGVKITEEQIRYLEERAKDVDDLFVNHIAEARQMKPADVRGLEARTFIAERARKYKLIDKIMSHDAALSEAKQGKFPEAVKRGPAPEKKPEPAATRSRIMLKPEQLLQARTLPGAAHITAENADEVLLQAATSLNERVGTLDQQIKTLPKAAATIDPKLAEGHIKLFLRTVDAEVRDNKLLPGQRDVIKLALNPKDGEYLTSSVQTDGTVLLPSETILKIAELNKPNGAVGDPQTGLQPAPKHEPGDKPDQIPTFEKINETRATYNLAPITREEYASQYPQKK